MDQIILYFGIDTWMIYYHIFMAVTVKQVSWFYKLVLQFKLKIFKTICIIIVFMYFTHINTKFTLEETNNSINFLDLTITKINNKLNFSKQGIQTNLKYFCGRILIQLKD